MNIDVFHSLEQTFFSSVCSETILATMYDLGREVGVPLGHPKGILPLASCKLILALNSDISDSELLAFEFGFLHSACCRDQTHLPIMFSFMCDAAVGEKE